MAKFNAMVLVLGFPVCGDTVEATNANEARAMIENRFWKGADELRATTSSMDATNKAAAEKLLPMIDKTISDARAFGITVEARKSRAA